MPPVRTPKSPAQRRSPKKNHQSPEPDVEVKPPVLYQSRITNDLYHQILIKTLEHALSKNMDWYEMSQEILADEEAMSVILLTLSPKKGIAKGKGKGKGKVKEAEQDNENEANEKKESNKDLTGTELHDHFHNVIFPALKSGVPIWLATVEPLTPTLSEESSTKGSQSPGMPE